MEIVVLRSPKAESRDSQVFNEYFFPRSLRVKPAIPDTFAPGYGAGSTRAILPPEMYESLVSGGTCKDESQP